MDLQMVFHYDKKFDCAFIHELVNFLVSRGVRYNANNIGHYLIMSLDPDPSQDIYFWEKEINDSTEKLSDIIDIYCKLDIKRFFLSINLDYPCDANTGFLLSLVPCENDNCSRIIFYSNTRFFVDEKAFLVFINLCTELFESFNFSYGGLEVEDNFIPSNSEEFLKKKPSYVNYYSKPLVEKLGRKELLSEKARERKVLNNGGIMLLVCPIYDGHYGCI